MSDAVTRRKSWWIRFVEIYLLWIGGRSVFMLVVRALDANYRTVVDSTFGQLSAVGELAVGVLAIGAAVMIHSRYRHALMMATAAMAVYAGLAVGGLHQTTSNLPAAREAYRASREARGLHVTDQKLDRMFSPEMVPMMWVVLGFLTVPPYLILLWKKGEFAPGEDES